MTIIDKYISTTMNSPASKIATELGISENFVKCRREILITSKRPVYSLDIIDEIRALINLIDTRKTGWAVDIAKNRIKQLEALAKI